jgi:hypothetical protein
VVNATSTGFSHVIVLKSPAAAAKSELREVRYRLGGDVTVTTSAQGGVTAATGAAVLASAERPNMWDSTVAATAIRMNPSSAAGPIDGARTKALMSAVRDGELIIGADASWLSDPSTRYPVFIDPDFSTGRTRLVYATSDNANGSWDDPTVATGDTGGDNLRVGLNPVTGNIYRSFLEFPLTNLAGKHVLGAKVAGKVDHTWKCSDNRPSYFYRADTPTAANRGRQAWAGPTLRVYLGNISVHANEDSCSEANQPFELATVAVTADVQARVNASASSYTVGITARDSGGSGESTGERWMRFFANDFRLLVSYNSYPTKPTTQTAQSGTSTTAFGCVTGSGRPWLGVRADGTLQPILKAVISDPEPETDLRAKFTWERSSNGGSTWTAGGTFTAGPYTRGATASYTIPTSGGLADGQIVRWKAQTLDPWSYGGTSGTDTSLETGFCEFGVDKVVPVAPDVDSASYPDDGQEHGSAGVSGAFTLMANGSGDVTGYKWSSSTPPTTLVAAPSPGASTTLTLTPPPPQPMDPTDGGQVTLFVRSVDRAKNEGPIYNYSFLVGQAGGLVGKWDLTTTDGNSSVDWLADSAESGLPHGLTNVGVTAGMPGRVLSGPDLEAWTTASFDGTSSYLSAGAPVIDTAQSFTVAAWVRPEATTGWRTVVAAPGTSYSAFYLTQRGSRWQMRTTLSDAGVTSSFAESSTPIRPGLWTHVVGVFDAQGSQLRLYVDGTLAASAARGGTWTTGGSLTIGRALSAGVPVDYFDGDMGEVRIWNRVLAATEIGPLSATTAGRWRLDGDGSEPVYGRDLTSGGGVAWTDDEERGPVATLDGIDGQLPSGGPAVRTDQSFSLSAWTNLDTVPTTDEKMLAQDSSGAAGFTLGVRYVSGSRYWAFCMKDTIVQSSTTRCALATAPLTSADVGRWVHIVGVYDATKSELKLYVNGVTFTTKRESSPGVPVVPWHAPGPFAIGRESANGSASLWYDGSVDDVRAYAGALSAQEVAALCSC